MQLSNRTVLITGGTSGIGLGLAEAFEQYDSKVIVCGRNQEKLSAIEAGFPEISTFQCDVGDHQQRNNLAEHLISQFPNLDILINNAGIQRYIDLKKGYRELKAGEDEITINFTSVVELTALFMEHLLGKDSAAIVNVSSGLGFMPMLKTPVYSATKAAVHIYTLVLRQQLKDTSVQVFEVVPPMVNTNLNQKGRASIPTKQLGISLSEYIPTVIDGLANGAEMIFFGDGKQMISQPRSKSESRLLNL